MIHILLIGGDSNYAPDMNTDTLIVAVINRKTDQVSLLSIPRDLWVYIPTHGYGRINTAHRIGARTKYEGYGPGLLMRTIEENLGIPIDDWVRISYDGFRNIVDEMGGVDLVVPCPVNLRYQAPTSSEQQELVLEPGVHHLDGDTALRYVRTRRGDTDFGRSARQQQFLKSVWAQMMTPDIIPKIPALWSGLKDNFQTNLKLGDLLALAPVALNLRNHHIRSCYIGRSQVELWTTPEGWSVLLPVPEKIEQVVASLYAPPSKDEDKVATEGGRVQLLNGTERPYLARIAADQLAWEGLTIEDIAAAERTDYQQTQILILNEKPEALALLVELLAISPENVVRQLDPDAPVDIRVILGQDYDPCR